MSKLLDDKAREKSLVKWAQRAYPGVQVRVQPVPNIIGTKVYQVHTRPERTEELKDFDWVLREQGEPEHLQESLRRRAKEQGT